MYTLAIDPGKTSGAVIVSGARGDTLVAAIESFDYDPLPLMTLINYMPLRIVVIERPPQQGDDTRLLALYGQLWQFVDGKASRADLYPGQWKPVVKAAAIPTPKDLKSRHVKDAWYIAWYYLNKTLGRAR